MPSPQISNLEVQRWNCSERSASSGVASPALHSELLRLADCNCLYLRSQPQGSVARQLSHALSLGPLRLRFLLGLGSYWEEQGQVPGKSPGVQESFRGASVFPGCRDLSGLSAFWDPGVQQL